jgi:hypothetical protein
LAHKGCADLPANRKPQSGSTFVGHSKIESTVRYLGIEVDDAIEIAEKIDI